MSTHIRTPQACDACRRRKTKCDGTRPTCRFCSKRQVSCSWSRFQASPQGPQGEDTSPASALQASMQASVLSGSSTSYNLAEQTVLNTTLSPVIPQPLPEHSYRDISVQQIGSSKPYNISLDPAHLEFQNRQPDSGKKQRLEHNSIAQHEFLPKSGHFRLLIDIFFEKHHDVEFCSFLERSAFELQNIHQQSPFLLTSIVLLASLDINDNTALKIGFDTAEALAEFYLQIARKFSRDTSDVPTVSSTQANLILALYELLTSQGTRSYMFTGTAIRMALALRLGREFTPRRSPREKEVRRRTYWACIIMDRLVSYCTARAQSLLLRNTSIQLPCPQTNFAFNEEFHGPSLDDMLTNTSRLSSSCLLQIYITSVALWGNMASLWTRGRRRETLPPTDPATEMFRATSLLERWCEVLPPKYQWSLENYILHKSLGQGLVFVNMSFLLQHAHCVAHQEYIPHREAPLISADESASEGISENTKLPVEHQDKFIRVCVESANNIVEMMQTLSNHPGQVDSRDLQSPFITGALITAATVFLWVRYVARDRLGHVYDPATTQTSIDFILETLYLWGDRWKISVAWADTLNHLCKLYELAYSSTPDWNAVNDESAFGAHVPAGSMDDTTKTVPIDVVEGAPDPESTYQTMSDKIRIIAMTPLDDANEKKRIFNAYARTLWRHMWLYDSTEELSTLTPPLFYPFDVS